MKHKILILKAFVPCFQCSSSVVDAALCVCGGDLTNVMSSLLINQLCGPLLLYLSSMELEGSYQVHVCFIVCVHIFVLYH